MSSKFKIALMTGALLVLPATAALADGGTTGSPIADGTIAAIIASILLWLAGIPH